MVEQEDQRVRIRATEVSEGQHNLARGKGPCVDPRFGSSRRWGIAVRLVTPEDIRIPQIKLYCSQDNPPAVHRSQFNFSNRHKPEHRSDRVDAIWTLRHPSVFTQPRRSRPYKL